MRDHWEALIDGGLALVMTVAILSDQQRHPGLRYLLFIVGEWIVFTSIITGAIYGLSHSTTTEESRRPFPWWIAGRIVLIMLGYLALLAGILFLNGTRW